MTDPVGSTIGGCKITGLFSSSDIGTFYSGVQSSLKRPVSLWLIPAEQFEGSKERVGLFKERIASLADLSHPNLVHVYNTGKKKEYYYVILEELKGRSLFSAVREAGGFEIAAAVQTAAQAAQGLEAVLSKGQIHGNLTPETLFTVPDKGVQIAGFGLEHQPVDVISAEVNSLLSCMSPERCRGEKPDLTSDIFSLGIILYFSLTGDYPYKAESAAELISKIEHDDVPRLPDTIPGRVSAETAVFLQKCMAKNPANRFQTYPDCINALKLLAKGEHSPEQDQAAGDTFSGVGDDSPFQKSDDTFSDVGGDGAPGLGVPSSGSGTLECPECKTAVDQPQIIDGKAICPMCSASFEIPGTEKEPAGAFTTETFTRATGRGNREDAVAAQDPAPAPVSSEPASPEAIENLDELIRKVILLQPSDVLKNLVKILDAMKISSPGNLILPENVILADPDRIEIRPCNLAFEELSPEGAFFASPELCEKLPIGHKSHIYSLGILTMYMLSGHLPFDEPDTELIREFHLGPKTISPSKLNPAVSPTFERIIFLMLGVQGYPRLEDRDELKNLVANELMRLDGVEVSDRVSEPLSPADSVAGTGESLTSSAETPVSVGSTPEQAEQKKKIPDSVNCSSCGTLNIPQDFLCKQCGKLLLEENPSLEISKEGDFIHIGSQLIDNGNLGDAMMVLRRGAEQFPSSSPIRELVGNVDELMVRKNAEAIARTADEYASGRKYSKAITEWLRAGEMSEEVKTQNADKIKWARSQLRKRKILIISVLLLLIISGAAAYMFMFPSKVAEPVYNLFAKFNIRLKFIEGYVPEDRPDLSGSLTIVEMMAYLDKYNDKKLTEQGKEDYNAVSVMLVDAVGEKLSESDFWQYRDLLDNVSKYITDNSLRDRLKEFMVSALEAHIIETVSFSNGDREIILGELRKLIPAAEGTRVEKKLEEEISIQHQKIRSEKNTLVLTRARADVKKARDFYAKGDHRRAESMFRNILSTYTDEDLFGELRREVEIRLAEIRKYEARADDLLAQADVLRIKKDFGSYIELSRKILRDYPYSAAAAKVKVPFELTSVPGNARVEIDGIPSGRTPCRLQLSPKAENEIRVFHDGFIEKKFRLADMVFSPDQKDWALDVVLSKVETAVVVTEEKLTGLGFLGEMFYSAGTEHIYCFRPFSKNATVKKIAYPPDMDFKKGDLVQFTYYEEEYSACIRRDRKLMMFNPITEYITVLGEVGIDTVRPITVSPFYPGNETGLFFRGTMGEIYCYTAEGFRRKWSRRSKAGNTGTDLAVYKQYIITDSPEGKGIAAWTKSDGKPVLGIPMQPSRYAITVENGEIFACSGTGELLRYNLIREKRDKWRINLPEKDGYGTVAPIVNGGDILLLTSTGICTKVHRRVGEIQWRKQISKVGLAGGVFFENSIYIYDLSGTIYRIDSNGAVKDRFYGREPISSELQFMGGSMFFVTNNGRFVRYAL